MIVFILLMNTSGGSRNVEIRTIFLVVIYEFITVYNNNKMQIQLALSNITTTPTLV